MKTTLKILPLLFGVMLFFTQCEKDVEIDRSVNAEAMMTLKFEHNDYCMVEQDLWAGAGQNNTDNGTLVGKVIASITGNILTVQYVLDEPWEATEYHLWVGTDFTKIPRNAAPGRFPYSDGPIITVTLGDDFTPGTPIYLAAHAVVTHDGGVEALEAMLPETAKFSIVLNRIVTYLTTTVTEGGMLDGVYGSYCIDSGISIEPEEVYDAWVYSSYALPDGFDKVDYPENFPLVNWIINYIEVGDYYTYADVQRAIWELLETAPQNIADPPIVFDPDKVADIIDAAEAYEEDFGDFVPECGQYLVIVLDPVQAVQPLIIWKLVPCGESETAWAIGGDEDNDYTFSGNGIANKWGWFFDMTYCK